MRGIYFSLSTKFEHESRLCGFIMCQSKAPTKPKTTSFWCCSRCPKLVKSQRNQIWKAAFGQTQTASRHYFLLVCRFALSFCTVRTRLVYFSVSRDESQPFGGRQLSLNLVFVLPKHITRCFRMRCVNARRIYFLGSWGTLMCPVPLTSQFRLQAGVWIPIIPTERSRRDFKCLRMTVNNKERDTCTQDIC